MTLRLLPMNFSVCQVADAPNFALAPYTFLARTEEEISLVCPGECVPEGCLNREDGWRCFQVAGPLDFSLVGILSAIAGCLAAKQIPIFAVSTYNTAYVMVKEEKLTEARAALTEAGYEIRMK